MIGPGDLVVYVGMHECALGPGTHDGYYHEEPILVIGSFHVVARAETAAPQPGGWVYFEDGDDACDGCCRKVKEDAEPCEAEFKQLVKRPVRQKEPSDA